jgi:hypothetical protein
VDGQRNEDLMLLIETERCRKWGKTDFVDKLIHAGIASHYNSDRSGNLHATA